jgi:cell division protein FtsI (penicillin-binding protein 3)
VLDEPMGGTYAGGSVAAPVFRRVGEMALRYLGVTPRNNVVMKLADVSQRAKEDSRAQSAKEKASAPSPAAATRAVHAGEVRVPDLGGFPAREAVKATIGVGLTPLVEGTGRLSRQDPPAGSVVPKGASVKLVFEPPT